MREWGNFLHRGRVRVAMRMTILENCARICEAVAKCKSVDSVDLSEACIRSQPRGRQFFAFHPKIPIPDFNRSFAYKAARALQFHPLGADESLPREPLQRLS